MLKYGGDSEIFHLPHLEISARSEIGRQLRYINQRFKSSQLSVESFVDGVRY